MTRGVQGKKLLVLGGIKTECDIVIHAQRMGIYVIVADSNPDAPAVRIADEFANISATDVDAIVEFCRCNRVDGITTGFVDILMTPCYEACKRLGLPYYANPQMISMATDKVEFKSVCEEHSIPVPRTYYVGESIPEELLDELVFPVFVKPLDASGSRGAGVCRDIKKLTEQFEIAVEFSPSNNAIIEDYITGTEFLLDYVGVDGEFRLLSMFDRYMSDDRSSAINYSNISMCPSKYINKYYETINDSVVKMFKSLNFTDGLIFLQGYCSEERIVFYEMGCRLGGSFFNLEKEVLGLDPVDMVISYALTGKMIDNIEMISSRSAVFKRIAMVCNYILKDTEDTISIIKGIDDVKQLDSFVALIQHRDVGCSFRKDSIVDKPVLSFFMTFDDIDDAKATISHMNDLIQVENSSGQSLLSMKYDALKF